MEFQWKEELTKKSENIGKPMGGSVDFTRFQATPVVRPILGLENGQKMNWKWSELCGQKIKS